MIIAVTRKDIRAGRRCDTWACPVSLAVKRQFPRHRVCTGYNGIYVRGVEYVATGAVRRFIRRYDAGLTVQPFSFRLQRSAVS